MRAISQGFGWMMGLWLALTIGLSPIQAAPLQAIADIRHQPPSTPVTVQGQVTVPSGAFASGTGDRGFAIQDATAGIYISTPGNWQIGLDQAIQVTGTVQDDGHGLLVLKPQGTDDLRSLDSMKLNEPRLVSTGMVGEATEGELVRLVGAIVEPLRRDPPYGVGIMIDDGSGPVQVFVNETTGITIPDWTLGQRLKVQGFSGQYEQYIEVSPRVREDIVLIEN
ncbi:MAG: DNA-binding protein [Spirulina sp. SIO3F2]|nr:DNA-binding protein [Spirulina sp. SIO3F2]